MGCFDVKVSFRNALINLVHSYKGIIKVYKDLVNIILSANTESPEIEIMFSTPTFEISKEIIKIDTINVSVVCDINYGIPLYAQDGSIYTIDGKAVYVRSAKLIDFYE